MSMSWHFGDLACRQVDHKPSKQHLAAEAHKSSRPNSLSRHLLFSTPVINSDSRLLLKPVVYKNSFLACWVRSVTIAYAVRVWKLK